MNPQMPYGGGQHIPLQPHRGRHDGSYGRPPPPQMSPHPGYSAYYPPPMGPMMPPYQHYPQQWYAPYQPNFQPAYHGHRNPYYQAQMPPPQQMQPHHGPLVVSSQPQIPQTPRTYALQPQPQQVPMHPRRPSLVSMPSNVQSQSQTPPSRPTSQVSVAQDQKEEPVAPVQQATIPDESTTPNSKFETPSEPFNPPIPWLSVPDQEFPPRAQRGIRRILRSNLHHEPLHFPPLEISEPENVEVDQITTTSQESAQDNLTTKIESTAATSIETPTTVPSDAPSDAMSSQPTTPSSAIMSASKSQQTPTQTKSSRVVMPVVPIMPAMPTSPVAFRKAHRDSVTSVKSKQDSETGSVITNEEVNKPESLADSTLPVASAPKSWADLVRKQSANTGSPINVSNALPVVNGTSASRTESLGEVLGELSVAESPSKLVFLEPRGLVNTGNMCYMNSVLQTLVFCVPFYDFLDKVAQKAAHTFKSTTPLIDAMIMFMREYNAIDTASSVEQLRLRLKPEDFEKYGDPLRPDFVYDTINKLPRFRDMRRGHQQDAQEFLGFLLEELHEECAIAMQKSGTNASSGRSTPVGSVSNTSDNLDGWLEVGHKQKPSVTRNSGAANSESPVNNIFGGKLRSELKIAGNKLSVTLEPYQPLQLDIGSPQVSNIIDALKGLTKPESMQGDFQSVRGTKATATKQVFIETMPPVLVLHLKRFQYDSATKRAEKIWKKVGYPLELEIPKEVFQPTTRNKFAAHGGLPKYRLTGVIYHHGRNANGGHYTVDIRRQDGKEWIRIDDTMIRRIRSDDVAEGGSEEDPKVLAAALEKHKKQAAQTNNRYENIEADEDEEDSGYVWSQVANGHGRSKSTISVLANGNATPSKDVSGPQTPRIKESVKDNKVAYLLFYQRIGA